MYLVLSLGYGGGVDPFTVSLNDQGWQGPLEVILSIPHAQTGPPPASYSRPCLDSFLVSSGTEIPQSLWATCARAQSPSQEKGASWHSEGGNLLCFLLVPIVSGSVTGHHWKEPDLAFCVPSFQVFISLGKIIPKASCPQAEQFQQSQSFLVGEMLQSLNYLHAPFLDPLQYVHVSLAMNNTELDTTPGGASPLLSRGEGSPSMTCWEKSNFFLFSGI